MSVVKRGWLVAAPGKGGRMDYLSLCFVCGALVLDASEDGQSTWRRHMDWHSPEERKTVHDEMQRDRLANRLRTERDQARAIAVALEQEIAQCKDGYRWHQQQGTADSG